MKSSKPAFEGRPTFLRPADATVHELGPGPVSRLSVSSSKLLKLILRLVEGRDTRVDGPLSSLPSCGSQTGLQAFESRHSSHNRTVDGDSVIGRRLRPGQRYGCSTSASPAMAARQDRQEMSR
jgi:hypothetical protein